MAVTPRLTPIKINAAPTAHSPVSSLEAGIDHAIVNAAGMTMTAMMICLASPAASATAASDRTQPATCQDS
jgi:hypothetical protein